MCTEVKTSINKSVSKPRRKRKVVELIEVGGKIVSKTSTGKRKFHNKSKNGCENCKRRRVKCDEAKPACKKCSNMKLDCNYPKVTHIQSTITTTVYKDGTKSKSGGIKLPNQKKNQLQKEQQVIEEQEQEEEEEEDDDDEEEDEHDEQEDSIDEGKSNNILEDPETPANVTETKLTATNDPIKQEESNLLFHRRRGSMVLPLNSPDKQGNMDSLLLPSLSTVPNFANSQFMLPQLMSLSNSEKFSTFDLSGGPNSANVNTFGKNNNINIHGESPLQSIPLNASNSISSLLSVSRFSTLPNLNTNANSTSLGLQSQQSLSNNLGATLAGSFNKGKNNHNIGGLENAPVNPLSLYGDSIALVSKLGLNLKGLSALNSPGFSMGQFDFQDLGGLKSAHAMKVSIAEEVLTNMHKQMTKSMNLRSAQNNAFKNNNNGIGNVGMSRSGSLNASILSHNPTISPVVPVTPMTRNLGENESGVNILNSKLDGDNSNRMDTSPSAATLAGRETIDETKQGSPKSSKNSMDVSGNDEGGISDSNEKSGSNGSVYNLVRMSQQVSLNLVDLKLFYHYCTKVWPTIISAGITGVQLWSEEIPELSFEYPFLMHSILAFSATHLSRSENGLEHYVSSHRIEALRLLREAVLEISPENTDALVASALILIMDSLANAAGGISNKDDDTDLDKGDKSDNSSVMTGRSSKSSNSRTTSRARISSTMSPSAWIFHVKGASTILTAVWPLSEKSRFHDLISIDLSEFGDILTQESDTISELVCFDESIADLYPVEIDSPYLITLAYLDKLHRDRSQPNFILRVFAFPALLDKTFLALLMTGDLGAMRIMRSYYKLLRGYTTQVMETVWFLEGVPQVLPQDVDEYSGGGMHMMLDFLGGGLPSMTTTNLSEFV
ncbi:hypothetical protein Kpol_1031p47 [Vanderwaltozyma polyspora DSM 70294]|uniref:Zn(2)-C6 fungal-type domain-containing protein n=1 Tax=Vanderwaltozyma polyspora (strain ATCC 22028 / DSM 70294 / BCRC 21397 / CBS 2163 / NBRC 10782 / NRRL Y-8283 / UCD 57-17) TaxID=436907 RepID=A7THX9_VANPO|nr:uncharacterized protein Kpol_1031p47 [Vanderwaltozyma polyspora DSM 70294]EDO18141.1 hypothetical protein Kpol_1031p47 [Vanderwaltozyma polyspora DSM 70294]